MQDTRIVISIYSLKLEENLQKFTEISIYMLKKRNKASLESEHGFLGHIFNNSGRS